jgi:hypothetical protein
MHENYLRIIRLYQDDIISKFGHTSHFVSIKEFFDKQNQVLLEYFNKCLELTETSIFKILISRKRRNLKLDKYKLW